MSMRRLPSLILLASIILAVVPAGAIALAAQVGTIPTQQSYKWVFMVYLDADNNLEDDGISDFNEMEMAGSTSDVAIVVMFDRHPGYDTSNGNWSTTRIYLVQHDTDPENISSQLLVDLGEMNMGDPNTLVFFVNYTVTHFPADHYALVIWDHGDAWRRSGGRFKGVAWDYTNGYDYITEQELIWALTKINSMIHLDLIGFDVCLLGMVEIAYDISSRGLADVMVASQEFEPAAGWYYTPFLQFLITHPNATAQQLGEKIVEAYGYYYTNVSALDFPTLAAIDLVEFAGNATTYLNYLSLYLLIDVYLDSSLAHTIKQVRDACEKTGEGEFIDIYDFAHRIASTGDIWPSGYDPRPLANLTAEAIKNATIAYWSGPGHPHAHGISIYLPPTVDWYLEERYWYFKQTFFPTETYWGLFLDYYFKAFTPAEEYRVEVSAPQIVTAGSSDYALVQVSYGSRLVEPDYLYARIILPDGRVIPLSYMEIDVGRYVIEIPPLNGSTTAFIVVDAGYWFLDRSVSTAIKAVANYTRELTDLKSLIESINASIVGIENGLAIIRSDLGTLAVKLDNLNASITEVKNGIAYIKTALGTIEARLSDLNASIIAIRGDIAVINTSLGTIETKLDNLNATITRIDGNVVLINTTLGTIRGEIAEIKGNTVEIKTDLGTLRTSVDNVKNIAEEAKSRSESLTNLVYAVIGLVVVTLAAAGFAATKR